MSKNIVLVVGVLSVVILGFVILFHSPGVPETPPPPERTPEENLALFLTDKMNYDVRFARMLAEQRIETAKQIAADRPDLEALAREVIDSLRERLDRRAEM